MFLPTPKPTSTLPSTLTLTLTFTLTNPTKLFACTPAGSRVVLPGVKITLVIPREEITALLHNHQIQPFFTFPVDLAEGGGAGGGGGSSRKSPVVLAGGGGSGTLPPGQGETAKARKLKQQASVFMDVIGDEVVGNKFDEGLSGIKMGYNDDMTTTTTTATATTDYAMIVPALFALRALLERGWQPDHMPPEVISSLVHILCCAQTAATPNERIRVSEALTALLGAAIGIGPDASELVFAHLLAAQSSLSTTSATTTAATADVEAERQLLWRSPRSGGRDVVTPPVRGVGLGFNSVGGGGGGSVGGVGGGDLEDTEDGDLGIPSATASVIRLLAHVLYEEAKTDHRSATASDSHSFGGIESHLFNTLRPPSSSSSSSNNNSNSNSNSSNSNGASNINPTGGPAPKSKYSRDITSVVFGHIFAAAVYKEPLPAAGALLPLRQTTSSNGNTGSNTTHPTPNNNSINSSAAVNVANALSILRGPVNTGAADTPPNTTTIAGLQTLALSPLRGTGTGNPPIPPGGVHPAALAAPITPGRAVPPTPPINNMSPARVAVLNAAVNGFGGMAAVNNTNNANTNANQSFSDPSNLINMSSPRKHPSTATTPNSRTSGGIYTSSSQSPRTDPRMDSFLITSATTMLPEFTELLECVFRINRARRMEKLEEEAVYSRSAGSTTEQSVNSGNVRGRSAEQRCLSEDGAGKEVPTGANDETSAVHLTVEPVSISHAIRRDLQQKLFEKANECFAMVPPYNAVSKKFDSATRGGRHIWQAGEPLAPGYLVDAMDREKSWFESYVTEIRPAMAPVSATTPPRANTPSRYGGYDVKVHFMGWGSKWDDWVPEKDVGTRISPLNTRSKNWRADLFEGGLIEIKCNEDMVNQKWMWGKIIALNYDEGWVDVSYTFTNEPTGEWIVTMPPHRLYLSRILY